MTILRLSGGNYIFLKLPVVVEPHFKFGFSVSKAKIPNFYHMSLLFLLYLPHVFEWGWTGEWGGDTLIRKRQLLPRDPLGKHRKCIFPAKVTEQMFELFKWMNYFSGIIWPWLLRGGRISLPSKSLTLNILDKAYNLCVTKMSRVWEHHDHASPSSLFCGCTLLVGACSRNIYSLNGSE